MVAQWNIKRRKMTQENVENLFEIHGKCMERHGLVRNLKEVRIRKLEKLKKKRMQTTNFENIHEVRGKQDEKCTVWC